MSFEQTAIVLYLVLGLATVLILRLADRDKHRTAGMGVFFFLADFSPVFWVLLAASWPMWVMLFFCSRPNDQE